jgi:hypothetical protein
MNGPIRSRPLRKQCDQIGTKADVIIDRLLDDLHADMAAEWRERGRADRLGRDDTPPAEGPRAGFLGPGEHDVETPAMRLAKPPRTRTII